MAERPVFVPTPMQPPFVAVVSFNVPWAPGFAPVQKRTNVETLHRAAQAAGLLPLLEISTKSSTELGRRLSAFSLRVELDGRSIPLESAFQGSKVFEGGGPYADLYELDALTAKRDRRLRESGQVVGFRFGERAFPTEPQTFFYDWLYICALYPHREWLTAHVPRYAGFTDIEFNPKRSINCQARSFALLVSLASNNRLDVAMQTPARFAEVVWGTENSVRQNPKGEEPGL
jgi:hypothetical protein